EYRALEVHGHVGGDGLQQHGGAVVGKDIVVEHGVIDVLPGAVEVKAHLIAVEAAADDVDPAFAEGQNAGLPVGKGAVGGPEVGGGGYAAARPAAREVQVLEKGDIAAGTDNKDRAGE